MNKPQEKLLNTFLEIAYKEVDVQEFPGASANPKIIEFHQTCDLKAASDEVSWCLHPETEILCECGWLTFEELWHRSTKKEKIKVAQVAKDTLTVSFVYPEKLVKKEHTGTVLHIKNRSVDLICDETHKFYGEWKDRGLKNNKSILELKEIRDIHRTVCIPSPIASTCGNSTVTDKDLEFLAMFISDGNYVTYKTGAKSSVRVHVSREDKIALLQNMNPYKIYDYKNLHGLNKKPTKMFYFEYPKFFDEVFTAYKQLDYSFILSLSAHQLQVFLNAYLKFDGTKSKKHNGNTFYSADLVVAEQLLTMVTLAGYKGSITSQSNLHATIPSSNNIYRVQWNKATKSKSFAKKDIIREEYEGFLYCVQVPSELILVKGFDGNPIITGNCSAFVNWVVIQAGIPGTNSAAARSWLRWGESTTFVKGCIVVLKRGDSPWQGHVGFGLEEKGKVVTVLGGNQDNSVCVLPFNKYSVLGYRLPKV